VVIPGADPATAGIPVIVLSAEASRGVIHRLLAGGAFAYLTKPIELAELGELLDTFATRAQDQQAQPAIQTAPA
jgi:CheY-like chemotaxis protein